jgi:hypothetical protein
MPEVTIRLIPDPETGKKNIIISMRSDEEALPHEHEQMHRQIADKVVHGGLAKLSDIGKIIVEREEAEKAPPVPTQSGPQEQRQAQGQGS